MESNSIILDGAVYDMINAKPRYQKNNKGVDIKICCASCRFEKNEDDLIRSQRTKDYRRCTLSGGVCEKHGVCNAWDIKHQLAHWKGFGEGDVKSKKYLDWYRQKYIEWKKLEDESPEDEKKDIASEYGKFCQTARSTYEKSGRKVYVL